jgi:hypothetical protein
MSRKCKQSVRLFWGGVELQKQKKGDGGHEGSDEEGCCRRMKKLEL